MKSWLQDNGRDIYLTHNEGKFVIAERFIRNWRNKIYKLITSVSKNVFIDEIDDIVKNMIMKVWIYRFGHNVW